MPTAITSRPNQHRRVKAARSLPEIRRLGYEGARQRQITNGWYARGSYDEAGEWQPQPGLPSDVIVLLPMGSAYEREHYQDKGLLPLSIVPNKRAMPHQPQTGEFRIDPPEPEELRNVMEHLALRAPDAIREAEQEIAEIDETLADSGSLMKGEAPQLRAKKKKLQHRMALLSDPQSFRYEGFYQAFLNERMLLLASQQKPEEVHARELEKERMEWEQHARDFAAAVAEAPVTDSTSSSKPSMKSTPSAKES